MESNYNLESPDQPPMPNLLVEAAELDHPEEELEVDEDLVVENVGKVEKRKRRMREEGGARKRFRINIPVINLNVEEEVDELKRRAEGEEEKDDALAVEEALKGLTAGEGRRDMGILRRRLEKLLGASKAEIEEELEN